MTAATDIAPMNTDHETSSSAHSDSGSTHTTMSDSTNPSSNNDCESPSSSIKEEHARVSPFARYVKPEHSGVVALQNAIATTLFNASPELLSSFVDPGVGVFKAVFRSEKQLVVWRKGNAGFVGVFEHHTSMKKFGFEHLVGFSIGWDGTWRVIVGAGNAFCESKWPVVWTGPYDSLGGVYEMVVDRESMEEAKGERAARLAARILEDRFWARTVNVKVT